MLFHIDGFKKITKTGPVLDNAKTLYSVGIVDGLNQQDLKLKDEILDKYVFCQVEQETIRYQIVLEKRMLSSTLRSQMRCVGEIIIFEDIVKLYLLRYAAAKEFNNRGKCVSLPVRLACLHIVNRENLGGPTECHDATL